MTETAVHYLKKMVFPYLSHEQKMLTGKFFYEAEMMEKEQIVNSFTKGFGEGVVFGAVTTYKHQTAEQYYKENYEK